jgi:alpha-D-ribose 1-methylphosphonate 5-triphosphate synthase subunit PhnG
MHENSTDPEIAQRQSAMHTLTLADASELEALYEGFSAKPDWQFSRKPETGLVMARGRMGGGGAPFNLGEITITRAAVTLESGETGYAWCQGRNQRKAAIAAFFDAAWLNPNLRARVEADILSPLSAKQEAADKAQAEAAAATKVDFFTLVRGDD